MPWGVLASAAFSMMNQPSTPATPDYTGAANAQGQANLDAARVQTALSRPNQITPWGSSTWTHNTANSSNQDAWSNTVTLSPEQQKLYDTQQGISQSLADQGQNSLRQVQNSFSNPFSLGGAPAIQYGGPAPTLQNSFGQTNVQGKLDTSGVSAIPGTDSAGLTGLANRAADAAGARANTQLDQQEESTKAQLAAQGITPGSDAYNRAMQPIQQARVDASNQAFLTGQNYENQLYNQGLQTNAQQFGQAQAQGQFANTAAGQQFAQNQGAADFANNAAQNQFQMGLAGNQFSNQAQSQAYSQAVANRQMPMNELNALRTGSQVQAPQFAQYSAPAVQPTPILQAAQLQGQANQNAYQNQLANYNNMAQGLFGLGGTGASYFGYSDRRMKRDITRIGTTSKGLPWYRFEYVWGVPSEGVMADEVESVIPSAVSRRNGYAVVDYSQVM